MVETVIKGSARRALSKRVHIDYSLPPDWPTPIGHYIDCLSERKLITLVEIKFSLGKHTEIIPAGYIFDGASIPRIFWGLKGFDPHGEKLWAALIHDWYCDKWAEFVLALELAVSDDERAELEQNAPLSLVVADAIFVSVLLDTGEETWRSIVMYLGVRAHHTFPHASLYLRRAVQAATVGGLGSLATAGAWWVIQNLLL